MAQLNWPDRFGFEQDLRNCIGRTIEKVEMLQMEHGSVWPQAFAVQFTDGTRAFFGGRIGTGIMNPQISGRSYGDVLSVATSSIFTKEELGEMTRSEQDRAIRRHREQEEVERQQYERLHKKFGGK